MQMGVSRQRLSGIDHPRGSKRRDTARAGPFAPHRHLHAWAVWRLPGLRREAQDTGATIWLGTPNPLRSSSPALSPTFHSRAPLGFAKRSRGIPSLAFQNKLRESFARSLFFR